MAILAEHANLYDDAESFVGRVRAIVRLWHGMDQPIPPPVGEDGADLTGFVWLTDEPFPAALPAWEAGRPVPG